MMALVLLLLLSCFVVWPFYGNSASQGLTAVVGLCWTALYPYRSSQWNRSYWSCRSHWFAGVLVVAAGGGSAGTGWVPVVPEAEHVGCTVCQQPVVLVLPAVPVELAS